MKHTDMTSREIITRVIEHRDAPRIGYNFIAPHPTDIQAVGAAFFANDKTYSKWGSYPELLEKVPNFHGEVRLDNIGNIFGRLDDTQGGECIRGVLQEDWGELCSFEFPAFDEAFIAQLKERNYGDSDKFVAVTPPVAVFSTLRDARLMENALADTLLEPEAVTAFLEKIQRVLLRTVSIAREIGAQAIWIYDDWGMQHAPFINPESFQSLFQPVYKAVADELHESGMKLILHSCGLVWDLIPHFIAAGIDVLQFDQPELSGSEKLAKTFGKQVTIFSPVDIQKIMPTGDRELIEASARRMIHTFQNYAQGAFIAKDYGNWQDIDVKWEWADWARNVFLEEGWK